MAKTSAYFAVKSISLSVCGGRKPSTLEMAARHNLREIQAEQGAKSHIDATRIRDNLVLAGPETASAVSDLARALLSSAQIDTTKMRRDHCQAIEVVFSLHEQSVTEPMAYFRRCLKWVMAAINLPVLSCVAHLDEAAPHVHVLLLPLQTSKYVGSSPITTAKLRQLRELFFTQVAGPAGLKRSGAKLHGASKRAAASLVLRVCQSKGIPQFLGALWQVLQAAIEHNPMEAVKLLGISDDDIGIILKQPQSPIGFESNPIEIEVGSEKTKPYLCVGFAQEVPSAAPDKLPQRMAGSSEQMVPQNKKRERLVVARAAMTKAADIHKANPLVVEPVTILRERNIGVVSVRDELGHDLNAWED